MYSRRIRTKLLHNTHFILFTSPTCFGQIYWPTSGSHIQRYFNFELSHAVKVVVVVVVFAVIKIIKTGFN